MRGPDLTAAATVRFTCGVHVRVTHPDYSPEEVMALLGQGQTQLEPVAPGEVGTLILDGFPYTVLGYYTFSVEDADYEQAPAGWAFHGRADDKARRRTREQRAGRAKAVKRQQRQRGRER
jgi:non-ribosomal peptide synthetase component E (peptide arylation enzyme)